MNDLHKPLGTEPATNKSHTKTWLGGLALVGIAAVGYLFWSQQAQQKDPTVLALKDATQEPEPKPQVQPEPPKPAKSGEPVTPSAPTPQPQAQTPKPAAPAFQPRESQRPKRNPWVYVPELIEESDEGLLPRIGPDGQRPLDAYAQAPETIGATRIAIVVGGLGLSQTGTKQAIDALPSSVTLGFSASGNSLNRWMQVARKQGHEVALQLPMEPLGYPSVNPGRTTLLSQSKKGENIKRLHSALGRMTNYPVVISYLGGGFLNKRDALAPALKEIRDRGLGFLDDGSVQSSIALDLAEEMRLPNAIGSVVLDADRAPAEIENRLRSVELFARRRGFAIATASAFPDSITRIRNFVRDAEKRGVQIVPLSNLIRDYPR